MGSTGCVESVQLHLRRAPTPVSYTCEDLGWKHQALGATITEKELVVTPAPKVYPISTYM